MNIYIMDDMAGAVMSLDKIINEKNLGEVVGMSDDAETGMTEIISRKPEIVIIDMLSSAKESTGAERSRRETGINGIAIIEEIKRICPSIRFIVLSKAANKETVQKVYTAGADLFIAKPVNAVEVESVIKMVSKQIEMEKTLKSIKRMLATAAHSKVMDTEKENTDMDNMMKSIQYILGILGMMGERGTADIKAICMRCAREKDKDADTVGKEYCNEIGESEKIVKQRIRRATKKGLVNMAHLGIEDSYSEVYQNYAQLVFDYENLRKEIEFIRGNSTEEGKVNITSFIEGLLIYSQNQ